MSSISDFSGDDIIDETYIPPKRDYRKRVFTSNKSGKEDGPSSSKKLRTDPAEMEICQEDEAARDVSQSLLFKNYFDVKMSNLSMNNKAVSAQCKICKKVLTGACNVTSNFIRHLKTQHKDKYQEYVLSKEEAKMQPDKQNQFDKLVLGVIANNMLPISIVESNSFRALLKFANPRLKVMSRPTTMKLIDSSFESLKSNFKDLIKSGGYFCTTADIWSTKHRSFFGYTCHLVNSSFERKSISLSCKRFGGVHSYDAIGRKINEIHEEFGLNSNNLVATTTDNGSNFVKAFREFGISSQEILLDEGNEEFEVDDALTEFANRNLEELLPKHIRCASHTLNLIATTDFNKLLKSKVLIYEKHKQVLKKCSAVWSKINRPKSSEQIKTILGTQLKYPVVTRWNSLYDSIKDLISHRSRLNELCLIIETEAFLDQDFDYLAEYVELLQPLAEAIDFLQKDEGMMFGYLLPALATVKTKFGKMQLRGGSEYCKKIAVELMAAVDNRFSAYIGLEKSAETAIVASVLCPQIKCQWVTALSPLHDLTTEADVIKLARNAVVAMFEDEILTPSPTETSTITYFDFSIAETPEELQCVSDSPAETEFLAYLSDNSKSINMLNKYPRVKQAFFKFNAPLPSSAAVERLFSFASLLNVPKRGSLLDENFEKLLLLKANNAV